MEKKFNIYFTKRANITISLGDKLVAFAPTDRGDYAYSTDNKQEIAQLEAAVKAGGVIYVDEALRTVDQKVEYVRAGGSRLGAANIGAATSTPPKEGARSSVAQEEAQKVNIGTAASSSDLGQAVKVQSTAAQAEAPKTLAQRLAAT